MHLHMCINDGMTCRNRESIFAANILDAKRGTIPLLELSGKNNRDIHVHFMVPLQIKIILCTCTCVLMVG